MQIYIIAQYLNRPGLEDDRLYKLGREYMLRGDQVTVLSTASGMDLELGNKKIGLVQKNGLPTVILNIDYASQMKKRQKLWAFLKFARSTARQGRLLPKPDLIIAVSPPLTAVVPALKLSEYYQVPLVVEIRELWPDAPIKRGSLNNRLIIKAARRLEEKVYKKADWIIAGNKGIADAVKERLVKPEKVTIIPKNVKSKEMIDRYEQVLSKIVK